MSTYNIYLNGKKINTVFYPEGTESSYVYDGLVNHDGYDQDIKIRKEWTKEYVIQGNYGHGYEDIGACETYASALTELREYRTNQTRPAGQFRLITRKVQS